MQVFGNRRSLIGVAKAGSALCAILAFGPKPRTAPASSHREAPVISDGVDTNVKAFLAQFPYLATPHQGYES